MRVGIFGGTFDPVHLGHLVLAEQCREQCQLDEIWFVPAGQPPHKLGRQITAAQHRKAMLELALAGIPEYRVSTIEIDRVGPSYTVITLRELVQRHPAAEFFLLIGADSLRDFLSWKDAHEIVTIATVVAVNRGAEPLPTSPELQRLFAARPYLEVRMPGIAISANEIRRRVFEHKSIRFLVPRSVEVYLHEAGLYGDLDPVKNR